MIKTLYISMSCIPLSREPRKHFQLLTLFFPWHASACLVVQLPGLSLRRENVLSVAYFLRLRKKAFSAPKRFKRSFCGNIQRTNTRYHSQHNAASLLHVENNRQKVGKKYHNQTNEGSGSDRSCGTLSGQWPA